MTIKLPVAAALNTPPRNAGVSDDVELFQVLSVPGGETMTIKTPVRITYEADARGFASYPHFVDADGYHVEFSALADALNATASAPDLTALREAVEAARASLARGDSEMEVTAKYLDIVDAAAALCPPKDGR